MGDCYILCWQSGVTWSALVRAVSDASGSFLLHGVARRSYRRPLSPSGSGCRCHGYASSRLRNGLFVSLELGALVLSLRLFFEKNFAVILVGGRVCGTRTHPCGAATRGSCPSVPRLLPLDLCGGSAGPGFTRACSPRHITAYCLETGPWAMLPRSFSYHPPASHGMSRLEVFVCLHNLKCCLYYFLEILDYISSGSLVPS